MRVFKFVNKKRSTQSTLISIVVAIIAVIVLLNLEIVVNKYFVYLLASILSFASTMWFIKKASIEIEEIIIDNDDSVKIYFFNKVKKPAFLLVDDLEVSNDGKKAIFYSKVLGKQIGIAYRTALKEINNWDELITLKINNVVKD